VTERGVTGVKPPDVKVLGNFRFFVPAWSSERLVTRLDETAHRASSRPRPCFVGSCANDQHVSCIV
ncbi:hypothetical protein BD309DRAFT_1054348, partial [Dichomitus squalens]